MGLGWFAVEHGHGGLAGPTLGTRHAGGAQLLRGRGQLQGRRKIRGGVLILTMSFVVVGSCVVLSNEGSKLELYICC